MIFAVPARYGPGTYFAIPAQHHYDEVYSPLRQYGQYSDTQTNKQTGRGRFRSPIRRSATRCLPLNISETVRDTGLVPKDHR